MCGICGLLCPRASSESELRDELHAMMAPLAHRGPDNDGFWTDGECGVGLGHRRLAVQDLSEAGSQPMVSQCGTFVITYNGEIYNFRELRKELVQSGSSFRSDCDTEVLLEAIRCWGILRTLRKCVGMFAFAVYNSKTKELVLARDRLGEKPLYYGWTNDVFLFGSELKALAQHSQWSGAIDEQAFANYLYQNFIAAPRSIFKGILKLPPATYLTVNAMTPRHLSGPQSYWSVTEASLGTRRADLDLSTASDQLDALLRDVIGHQMLADVSVGAFLSGGIDSSLITAIMQTVSNHRVRTFSVGFAENEYNEAPFAQRVAQHIGTDHTELYITAQDVLAVIPRLATIYDEPFADSSQIPTFLVAKLARESVTVALSGDGGDELFGGYTRYLMADRAWRLIRRIPSVMRNYLAHELRAGKPKVGQSPPLLTAARRYQSIRKLTDLMSIRDPADLYSRLTSTEFNANGALTGISAETRIGDTDRSYQTVADYMMYRDTVSYLPDDLLVKVDRATMAVSLEARAPYLDHRVFEFAWRLPYEQRVGKHGKVILRNLLSRYVPAHLTERPKMGFGIPLKSWLHGPLREWADDLLNTKSLTETPFLDPHRVQQKWQDLLDGRGGSEWVIWSILMYQEWFRATRSGFAPVR